MKFKLIEGMSGEDIPVELSSKVLAVSRAGFYKWLRTPESIRDKENAIILSQMRAVHKESRGTYGLPRIQAKLKSLGKSCGKGRIATLMKKAGISGQITRRFKIRTTDSNHKNPIAERLFKTEVTDSHPEKPNQVWASDISYVATQEGFLYLATYLDLFTRKVVGFSTSESMKTELILDALEMALGRQELIQEDIPVVHSDRGVQYASEKYRETIDSIGLKASMSRKGNCWDNAFAESFFATLKKELVYRENYQTKEDAKKSIFEYIEVWYNRARIHSSIGYMSPVQYEESLAV